MRQRVARLAISTLVLLLASATARGEIFVLSGGGRVQGEILNPDESPRQTYIVRTVEGARLTLTPAQVKQMFRPRPEQVEYEKIYHDYPDTPQGQWELAEWCREHRLLSERESHLKRLLVLDPDHEQGRRVLGYNRVDGKWVTQDERRLADGYRRYKGRWRLPQEIELLEEDRQRELAENEWKQKITSWRNWLGTNRHQLAVKNLYGIDDPNAVKALALAIQDDSRSAARLLYAESLSRTDCVGANRALAVQAMRDSIEEVRLTCLDYLKEKQNPESVAYFVSKLQSSSNSEINRAAQALHHLEDPTAIGALINALVTTHKYVIKTGQSGSMSPTFGSDGSSSLSMGGSEKIVSRDLANREVLDALMKLSGGMNFGFDVDRWKSWYVSQKPRLDLAARRDEP